MGRMQEKAGNLAELNSEDQTKRLAECHAEMRPELTELRRKLGVPGRMLREMGMPEDRIWASLVVATAASLELDLGTVNGLAAAALLADYQMYDT